MRNMSLRAVYLLLTIYCLLIPKSSLANELVIDENGNIGVGTTAPIATMDITNGNSKKINKFLSVPTPDNQYHYVKLFPVVGNSSTAVTISGRVSAYRLNDLGITATSMIHVSRGNLGELRFSQIGLTGNFNLVSVSDGGVDYVSLYLPFDPAGIHSWHLELQIYDTDPDSDPVLQEFSSASPVHSSIAYIQNSTSLSDNVEVSGRIQQGTGNFFHTYAISGQLPLNHAFHHDIYTCGATQVVHVEATITHWSADYRATADKIFYMDAYTSMSSDTILDKSTPAAGSWAFERVATGNNGYGDTSDRLRIKHLAGNYAALGNYYIYIKSTCPIYEIK